MLKKIDVPMEEDKLIELLEQDPIGRNADIVDFVGILNSIEGNYCICIDGEWGSGKSIFVRQLQIILRAANPQLADVEPKVGGETFSCPGINLDEIGDSYLPVYFNAWENDYFEDPLPALAMAIADNALNQVALSKVKGGKEFKKAVFAALGELLGYIPVIKDYASIATKLIEVAKSGAEVMEGEYLFPRFENRNMIRNKVKLLVDSVLPERAYKLVLFIDELDRCKPEYAVHLLEEVKALFTQDSAIIVCSTNLDQLSKSVQGRYGHQFDGARYLSRFFDLKVSLPIVEPGKYLTVASGLGSGHVAYKTESYAAAHYDMSLRDINRYMAEVKYALEQLSDAEIYSSALGFIGYVLMPLIFAMKHGSLDSYKALISQYEISELLSLVKGSDDIVGFWSSTIDRAAYIGDSNCSAVVADDEKVLTQFITDVVIHMFSGNAKSDSYADVRRRLIRALNDDSLECLDKVANLVQNKTPER